MGNRGCLHDDQGRIRRFHQVRRWIYCRLEFKGRRRKLMQPGKYSELFFLDEATALAAGHRPCWECMRARATEFRDLWTAANRALVDREPLGAERLDELLHADRLTPDGGRRTVEAELGGLPDGAIVVPRPTGGRDAGHPHLLWAGRLWPWGMGGYGPEAHARPDEVAELLTPSSTVRAIAAGFRPAVAIADH